MDLAWILDHELCLAERYRRFVSIALLKANSKADSFPQALRSAARRSDLIFQMRDSVYVVLMSETDRDGATKAISRLLHAGPAGEKNFSVTSTICSYPADGADAVSLLSNGLKSLGEKEEYLPPHPNPIPAYFSEPGSPA